MTSYHLCMSLEGAIRQSDKELRGMFQFPGGGDMTPHQARQAFRIQLMKGHRVMPLSPCDNFDPQTGCKGHPEDSHDEP
jgi:hypothetical protein